MEGEKQMNVDYRYCKKTYDIPIAEDDYQKWLSTDGGYIQDIMTTLRHGAWDTDIQTCDCAGSACLGQTIVRYISNGFIYKIK